MQSPFLVRKKVNVLRVYFHDYTKTSRYTKTQVEGFFSKIKHVVGRT